MGPLCSHADLCGRFIMGSFFNPITAARRMCSRMILIAIGANIYLSSAAIAQPVGELEQYPSSPVALFQNINSLITSGKILNLNFYDDSRLQAVFGSWKISRRSFDHIISLSFENLGKIGKENTDDVFNTLSEYRISIRAIILNNSINKVILDIHTNKPNSLSSKEMSEIFSNGWYIRDVMPLYPLALPPGAAPLPPVNEKQYSRLDHTTDTQVYAYFIVLSGTETLDSFEAVITESDE